MLHAQASLKCYSSPKAKANWTIGLRSGVSREFDKHNWQWELNSKNRSWTQLLFIQRDIGRHFMLEYHSMHQSTWRDTYHPDRTYKAITVRNERLHHNLILHYLFPEVTSRWSTGAGLGLGFLTSWQTLKEVYIQSSEQRQQITKDLYTDAPNLVFALTTSLQLSNHLYLSGQCNGSFLIDNQLSHFNVNAGMGYRF